MSPSIAGCRAVFPISADFASCVQLILFLFNHAFCIAFSSSAVLALCLCSALCSSESFVGAAAFVTSVFGFASSVFLISSPFSPTLKLSPIKYGKVPRCVALCILSLFASTQSLKLSGREVIALVLSSDAIGGKPCLSLFISSAISFGVLRIESA